MSARIQVVIGPDRGKTFEIAVQGTLSVGRSNSTDTKLTDQSVSRQHCRIEYDGSRTTLINLSSKGTKVNDQLADQRELHHGDLIRVGDTELRFALDVMSEAETLMQPNATLCPPAKVSNHEERTSESVR